MLKLKKGLFGISVDLGGFPRHIEMGVAP
jgi:hypothetical protein